MSQMRAGAYDIYIVMLQGIQKGKIPAPVELLEGDQATRYEYTGTLVFSIRDRKYLCTFGMVPSP